MKRRTDEYEQSRFQNQCAYFVSRFSGSSGISPASSNPFLAASTAMISLMTAAAAIVPLTIEARSGLTGSSTAQMMSVNTSDTPECGSSVSPCYFCTVSGRCVAFAPKRAPKYFPAALAAI